MMICDKHLSKMVLETAQLLCSPFTNEIAPYKRTHYNHPCAKWVRENLNNYIWLLNYGITLAWEYSYRYGKIHKSEAVIQWCARNMHVLGLRKARERTKFALAMPEQYKSENCIESYRNYYIGEKAYFAKWERGREKPSWFKLEG